MNKYESLKLENQLCFPIYLCSRQIINEYTPVLNEIVLTYTQYIVMLYFWEYGDCNVKTLGEALMLDSSTLTPLLKKLEAKGLIKRQRSNKDERNLVLSLTEEGNLLKDKALMVPQKVGKCLKLNEKDAIDTYKLMYKILNNLNKGDE